MFSLLAIVHSDNLSFVHFSAQFNLALNTIKGKKTVMAVLCRLRLQASPCGRQRSRGPARHESINGELNAKPHDNRTSCLPRKLAFPCTFKALKETKNTVCGICILACIRAPPETSVLSTQTLITQSAQPLNPLITGHSPLHSSLFDLQNCKVEIKEIKLPCCYTQKELVAFTLLPTK